MHVLNDIYPSERRRAETACPWEVQNHASCCKPSAHTRIGINDANLMLDKLAASDEFKASLDDKQLQNIANFVGNISPELAMKGWEALTRANGDAIAKMWSVELEDGKTFGNYIKEIVGQPKKD